MADNIRTFTSNIDKLTPSNEGAQAFEQEGRHVEADYARAGNAIEGGVNAVGKEVEKHQTLVESADVMNQMSNLEVQTAQRLASVKTGEIPMDPHDTSAAGNFTGQFDEQLSNIGQNLGTPAAREIYNRMAAEYKTRTTTNFIGMQTENAANDALTKFQSGADNYANLANQDPTYAPIGAAAIQLSAESIAPEHRAAYVKQQTAQVYGSSAEGMVGRVEGAKVYDPNKVDAISQYINDPKNGYPENMSPAKFAEINNRLDNARRSGLNTSIAGMELNAPAMLKQVQLTGEDPNGQIKAMSTNLRNTGKPDGIAAADALDQKFADAQGYKQANDVVRTLPAAAISDERAKLLDDFKNAPAGAQAAVAEAKMNHFDEAVKARVKAFSSGDPTERATWELENNPSVGIAYSNFKANPTPDSFIDYYQKSVADQRALHPGTVPSVLTSDMVDAAHSAVNDIAADTGPGSKANSGPMRSAQELQAMSSMYGGAWPQIAGDLRKKGVFNGDQFVAAGLYGKPDAVRYAETLLRASVLTKEQLVSQFAITDIKAQEAVRPEVTQLVASMGNINNGYELADTYINAAAKIIQVTNNQDPTGLVKSMFTNSYQFTGDGSTIRAPLGVNADQIGSGSKNVLSDLHNHDLVVPVNRGGNLGEINQKEAWTDAVKHNGVWYTSPDGLGATLYDGVGSANPIIERRNGKAVPLTLSWTELERLGAGEAGTKAQNEKSISTYANTIGR